VAKRNVVREAGRELIKKLHAERTDKGGPKYSEIIVVGHSLGSVIGCDVLYSVWQEINRQVYDARLLQAAECAAQSEDLENQRARQQELFQIVSANSNGWIVSRFVTLGSPLTHAQFLLASSKKEVRQRRERREFPSCPPVMENGHFSFSIKPSDKLPCKPPFTLHHAALFAATLWTNIYFPPRWFSLGDLIGGPLANSFGWGIKDVALKGCGGHTSYWKQKHSLEELRKAIGLYGHPRSQI
jgi:hypothetical protein